MRTGGGASRRKRQWSPFDGCRLGQQPRPRKSKRAEARPRLRGQPRWLASGPRAQPPLGTQPSSGAVRATARSPRRTAGPLRHAAAGSPAHHGEPPVRQHAACCGDYGGGEQRQSSVIFSSSWSPGEHLRDPSSSRTGNNKKDTRCAASGTAVCGTMKGSICAMVLPAPCGAVRGLPP